MNKRLSKKRQIMENSINVMFNNGYHGTGIKDLTDAAGIPKGSLYNYYVNKEDYVREALRYFFQVFKEEHLVELTKLSIAPDQRIKNFYKVMIKDIKYKGDNYSGCFIGKMTQEMAASNDSIQEVILGLYEEIINQIKVNLDEAKTNGKISSSLSSDIVAESINSSWQGALQSIKATRNFAPLDNFYSVLTEITLK